MAELLSKDTFETFTREHQKYLDSKFDKLAGCIDSVKTARERAWKEHAEESAAHREKQEKKFKKVHKYIVVGCLSAALLGAILAPSLGWTHVVGFITKVLTGTAPIGM